MQIIRAQDREYVVNLDWVRLSGEKPKSEIESIVKEREAPFGIVNKVDDRIHVGVTSDSDVKGMFSAAAVLAEAYDDIIVADKIGEDRYWIVAINGNQVLPGSDIIVNSDGIVSYVDEFLMVPSFSGDEIKVYASEEVVSASGLEVDGVLTFEELIASEKPTNECKIIKLNSKTKQFVVLGLVLAVAAAGAGGFWYKGELKRQAEMEELDRIMAAKQKKQVKADTVDLEKQNKLAMERAKEEERLALTDDFERRHLPSRIADALNTISNLKKDHIGGWKLADISINLSNNTSTDIQIEFSKVNGNTKTLREGLSTDVIAFSGNGDGAIAMYSFEVESIIDPYSNIMNDQESFIEESMDFFDKFKIKYSYEKPINYIKRASPIEGINDESISTHRIMPFKGTPFVIEGRGIESLRAAHRFYEEHKNVVLEQIRVTPSDILIWKLKGEIYETL